jgi:hypothetical protein
MGRFLVLGATHGPHVSTCVKLFRPEFFLSEIKKGESRANKIISLYYRLIINNIQIIKAEPCLKILDNVLVVNLVLTVTVITFRRVTVNLQHFQRTSGSYVGSVCSYVRLVTELRPIE